MASSSQNSFAEGQSISRPPFFDGSNYVYWKMRMQNFLIATDYSLWLVVKDGRKVTNTEDNYTFEDIEKIQRDAKAKNSLYCALAPSEFEKISSCDTAKEIWDKLQVAHEGTSQVKETKINLLIHEYESFMMKDNESIGEMFGRFQKITNTLKNLGERIEQPKQVKKILRSLPRSWMPKVTAIQEAKDLDQMTVEELMGSLMTHEVLVNQKEKSSEEPRGKKTLALKADSETEEEQDGENESSEDEELAMLSRRIKTLMKRKKGRHFPNSQLRDKKKGVPICYKCKKPGHMQYECEEKRQEIKTDGRKYQNYFEKKGPSRPFDKKKRAMLAWEMMEELVFGDQSEQEQEENHEAKMSMINDEDRGISFMAIHDEEEVTTEPENPDFEEMLNELYDDFLALKREHVELKKKFISANSECQNLRNEKEKCLNEGNLRKAEILRAENNALRKSLVDALQELKARKEPIKNRKRKINNHGKTHMWIPKIAVEGTQVHHTHDTTLKQNGMSKFSATNPPGPTFKWVPKSKS